MPKKKKFIDKKKAITFHLVHRSQHDPLAADENAPQRVLLPQKESTKKKDSEEEKKYGIYFDDEYDYLQHLRDVKKSEVLWVEAPQSSKSEKPKVNLPSSMFASNVEEEVGLLNKAAPQGLRLDLDPDIVAAMDDDFDYDNCDNILEEDFVALANRSPSESGESSNMNDFEDEVDMYSDYSDEVDELGSMKNFDTKSRFTDYSMSSSAITRNSQLTQLDEHFEQMFANYDESEIGALDCDEIVGEIDTDSQLFKMAAAEFEKERKLEKLTMEDIEKTMHDSDEESDPEKNYLFEIKEKEKWDCESILSTYSNIYNRPKLIKDDPIYKIKVDKNTGMPLASGKLTKKALAQLDSTCSKGPASICSMLSTLSVREANETPEQKKERKSRLKEYRKARRMERKANSIAFKEEKRKLEKTIVNNKISNRQGIPL